MSWRKQDVAQKLWEKSVQVNKDIERFTVGRDREMDLYLAKHDVLGSMAHITMLESIGLLTPANCGILAELKEIYAMAERGEFVIEDGVEDVHSQVELMLTRKLGRRGQEDTQRTLAQRPGVARPEALHPREIKDREAVEQLFPRADPQSETYKDVLMPGYTHLQIAMPSSFRPVVRGLCREPGGRHDVPAGRFPYVQPQSSGFCRRLRFVVPP